MAANVEALLSLVEIEESKMNDAALLQPNESVCPSLFGVRSRSWLLYATLRIQKRLKPLTQGLFQE